MQQFINDPRKHGGDTDAYDKAQAALGKPSGEPLQMEVSISWLREAVEFHVETVRALLRRLEPISAGIKLTNGQMSGGCADGGLTMVRAPVASAIDSKREDIEALTKEVQQAIRELQV